VEIDGYAHGTDDRPERDARRDKFLNEAGLRVERIAASEVLDDPHAVAQGLRTLAIELIQGGARPLSQLR